MTYNTMTPLLHNFLSTKIKDTDLLPAPGDDDVIATTLRIPADMKNYYQQLAYHMRVTLQSTIIQTLAGVMEHHVNSQVLNDARIISDRFHQVFNLHGIYIYNIPKFLKNFNINLKTLADDSSLIDAINDKLISFLNRSLNLNQDWILKGKTPSHREFCCYGKSFNALNVLKNTKAPITLRLFFDESIICTPTIRTEGCKDIHAVLLIENEIHGVKYKKPYVLKPLIWEKKKSSNNIHCLIEAMNVSENHEDRNIELYAGNIEEVFDDKKFWLNAISHFKLFETSFKYSDTSSPRTTNISASFEEVKRFLNIF